MVREIIHDPAVLRKKSEKATAGDIQIAEDLADTLGANRDRYPGMAACMIGEHKRIIALVKGSMVIPMFNPRILMQSGEYTAEEECPVLGRTKPARRYKTIRLLWQDAKMKEHVALIDGYRAQMIQHMIDHCDGVLI